MWVRQLLMGILGLSAGTVVAGGLFALIVGLGVVPRFAGKTRTADHLMLYESCIMAGGIIGNVLYMYHFPFTMFRFIMPLIGIFAGIFIGSWYMALAEMINTFPIYARRIKMARGMGTVILGLALGKFLGGCLYFYKGW